MVAFPSSPTTGQQYLQWTWDGTKWTASPTSVPQCGYLAIVGTSPASQVRFSPYNGDLIKLNGVIRQIPSAGITASASSCYVEGVAGQPLVANTNYYVYVFDTGSGLALDFSATASLVSTTAGNVGVVIKNGDNTRTLVGLMRAYQTAPNLFTDGPQFRFVRSWFNRPTVALDGGATSGGYSSSTPAQTSTYYWVGFANEVLTFNQISGGTNAAGGMTGVCQTYVNSAAYAGAANVTSPAAGYWMSQSQTLTATIAEGFSSAALYVSTTGGTFNYDVQLMGKLSR